MKCLPLKNIAYEKNLRESVLLQLAVWFRRNSEPILRALLPSANEFGLVLSLVTTAEPANGIMTHDIFNKDILLQNQLILIGTCICIGS